MASDCVVTYKNGQPSKCYRFRDHIAMLNWQLTNDSDDIEAYDIYSAPDQDEEVKD